MEEKKLRRSSNKMIFGICAGLAEHFGMDPTIMRAIFAIGTILTGGTGILVYLVLFFVMPENPDSATPA